MTTVVTGAARAAAGAALPAEIRWVVAIGPTALCPALCVWYFRASRKLRQTLAG